MLGVDMCAGWTEDLGLILGFPELLKDLLSVLQKWSSYSPAVVFPFLYIHRPVESIG